MRRFGVIVALGALLGLVGGVVTAAPALAGRGHKWELMEAPSFTLPPSFCGFKVRVTAPLNKVFFKVLKASDGSMTLLFTGSFQRSYRNLQTGKAITENVPGQAKATIRPDGSLTVRGHGHNEIFLAPADAKRFGLPTVSLVVGALTARFDSDGTVTSLSLHGHVLVDVCAALS